jgi:hypothetical protein
MNRMVEAAGPLVDRHEHVRRITAAWQNTVRNIVETGRLLIHAKDDIGHGGFEEMIRAELPFGPSTAQRLMQIAEDRVLSNTAHAPLLPASWMTLYELAKLHKHGLDLEVLIEEGAIHPKMERKDVRALLPAPEQREDDLPPGYDGSAEPEAETAEPAEDGLPPADDNEPANPLVVAWTKADSAARREFVRVCWTEITRAHDQVASANGAAAHLSRQNAEELDRWIESDK